MTIDFRMSKALPDTIIIDDHTVPINILVLCCYVSLSTTLISLYPS